MTKIGEIEAFNPLTLLHQTLASRSKPKKHLSFTTLRQALSEHIESLPDGRSDARIYSQHDALMSAFACMYFQDPSLAQFQKRMEEVRHQNNLRTLFGVENIPSDTQLRDIVDLIPSSSLSPVFKDYFERLRRHKHLESYAIEPGLLFCVIDGVQYYSSQKIHCECCLHRTHKNGETSYSHAALQGAILHPDKCTAVPVMPEAIANKDGHKKQDCETNAAKRFILQLRKDHPRQGFVIGGDGLTSHQPLIEAILEQDMHYLLVAKPGDHTYMNEWLAAYPELPSRSWVDEEGNKHLCRWQKEVPLTGEEKTLYVNYFDYSITASDGAVTYQNSWVTDLEVNEQNIKARVKFGRCRWKVENECFNTLKNQGYHLEHNFGHGKQHLSFNMYLLTVLAFFIHQIFEMTDGLFQQCRSKANSKRYLWENLRATLRFVVVPSWEVLLDTFLNPNDYQLEAVKGA